jgi:hypothetical protein
VAVHVHDAVEVARTAALAERAQLLSEQLDERATDDALSRQRVAVLVADHALRRAVPVKPPKDGVTGSYVDFPG